MTFVLPRVSPESKGVSAASITRFIDSIESAELELHSFMLLKEGNVIAEGWWNPYEPQMRHVLWSLSKSFTSTAVGFAVNEGLLSVDDQVISYFPELVTPAIAENLQNLRIRHLLSMSTGHAEDTMGYLNRAEDGDWVKAFLSVPITYEPGTHFLYNTGATYMLSAIVQRVTHLDLVAYLTPRLFEPLGIANPVWERCPRGICTGGFGLSVRTEDIAKFGQLYLQRGIWDGQGLLPASWIDEATRKQIDNSEDINADWAQGYGFQFWRCRHGAYRGDGAFGQYCVVFPEEEVVLAITSSVEDMQAVLNQVWDNLLPALRGEAPLSGADGEAKLSERLRNLRIAPPQSRTTRGVAESAKVAALLPATLQLAENALGLQTIELTTAEGANWGVRLVFEGSKTDIPLGHGEWRVTSLQTAQGWLGASEALVAAAYAVTDDSRLEIVIRQLESPSRYYLQVNLAQDPVEVALNMRGVMGWQGEVTLTALRTGN